MKRQLLLFGLLVALTLLLTACPGNSGPSTQRLTVELSGPGGSGTVSSSPEGIDCGETCEASFTNDTAVELTATAADGFVFDGFSANCTVQDGTPNICEVTMDAAKTVTATFSAEGAPEAYTLNVSVTGNGTITSTPEGIDCGEDCSEEFDSGTVVTLTAEADEGSEFVSFTNCQVGAEANSCTVTMDAAKTVEATFKGEGEDVFQLDVSVVGSGTVSSPDGIDCGDDCSETYLSATTVTLTAEAADGFTFTGFENCTADAENANVCTVEVDDPEAATAVTATFETITGPDEVTLTVETLGNGAGDVAMVVNDQQYQTPVTVDTGTEVTIRYVERGSASEDFAFIGWAGGCNGTVASQDCTLTLSEDTTVQAVFIDGDPGTAPGTAATRVASSNDDAEEYLQANVDSGVLIGDVKLDSGDLDLHYDDGNSVGVMSGVLFKGISLPENAEITFAYIQFRAEVPSTADVEAPPVTVEIAGQDIATAPDFLASTNNISARDTTEAMVTWTPDPWITEPSPSLRERTPNIASIVQEISGRDDWDGETMAFIFAPPQQDGEYQVNALNSRRADAFDGNSTGAPQLVIFYETTTP